MGKTTRKKAKDCIVPIKPAEAAALIALVRMAYEGTCPPTFDFEPLYVRLAKSWDGKRSIRHFTLTTKRVPR